MNYTHIASIEAGRGIVFRVNHYYFSEIMRLILPNKFISSVEQKKDMILEGNDLLEIYVHLTKSIDSLLLINKNCEEQEQTFSYLYKGSKLFLNTKLNDDHKLLRKALVIFDMVEVSLNKKGKLFILDRGFIDSGGYAFILLALRKKSLAIFSLLSFLNDNIKDNKQQYSIKTLKHMINELKKRGYIEVLYNGDIEITDKGKVFSIF